MVAVVVVVADVILPGWCWRWLVVPPPNIGCTDGMMTMLLSTKVYMVIEQQLQQLEWSHISNNNNYSKCFLV